MEKAVHGLSYLLTPRFVINGRFFTDKEEVASSIAKFVLDRGANSDVADAVLLEMSAYVNHIASLNGVTKQLVEGMNATQYWNAFGKEKLPLLFEYAEIINSKVCSSAFSERVWSIFNFVHNKLRNRLAADKVDKLVFLYVNGGFLDENMLSEFAGLSEEDFHD